jgi:hypothetical protein
MCQVLRLCCAEGKWDIIIVNRLFVAIRHTLRNREISESESDSQLNIKWGGGGVDTSLIVAARTLFGYKPMKDYPVDCLSSLM